MLPFLQNYFFVFVFKFLPQQNLIHISQKASGYVPKKLRFLLFIVCRTWFDLGASYKWTCCIFSIWTSAYCSCFLAQFRMFWYQQFVPRIWSTNKFCLGNLDYRYPRNFLDPKTSCIVLIILICNPLESRYYRSTEEGTKVLPRLYVKLKFVSLKPSSPGMVFKFDMHVLGINARAFKNYLFHFILLKWLVDNESTTSILLFVWSYIVSTCSSFLWYFVIFTFSSMVDQAIPIFFTDFYCKCRRAVRSFSLPHIHIKSTFLLDHFDFFNNPFSVVAHSSSDGKLFFKVQAVRYTEL